MRISTSLWLHGVRSGNGTYSPHARDALDSDARLRSELRRKDKALRYIHDNTECLLSHETARGALKKPARRAKP